MTPATKIKAPASKNDLVNPVTKAILTPSPPSPDTADRLGSNPINPIVMVTVAVARATPLRFAVVLVVFRNADAMPKCLLSNELMMALVLGELNNPIPIPCNAIPNSTCKGDESIVNLENNRKATTDTAMPAVVSKRLPNLSDSRPLIGPKIAMPMEAGISNNPALLGAYPRP